MTFPFVSVRGLYIIYKSRRLARRRSTYVDWGRGKHEVLLRDYIYIRGLVLYYTKYKLFIPIKWQRYHAVTINSLGQSDRCSHSTRDTTLASKGLSTKYNVY